MCSTSVFVQGEDFSYATQINSMSNYCSGNVFEPNGQKLKDGEIAKLKVKRNEVITLDVLVKLGMKEKNHVQRWVENKKLFG